MRLGTFHGARSVAGSTVLSLQPVPQDEWAFLGSYIRASGSY